MVVTLAVVAMLLGMLLLGIHYVWIWVRPFPVEPSVKGKLLLKSGKVDVSRSEPWLAHRAVVAVTDQEIGVSHYGYGPNLRHPLPLDYIIPLDSIGELSYEDGAERLRTDGRSWTFIDWPALYELLQRIR